ncbi:MAG TPA: lamin tail domain-containing protein [Candidatus Paceibacterota bacterium]|nr:lamin tail domain-containing protein [Candidatus Paceibacterota bacterium]
MGNRVTAASLISIVFATLLVAFVFTPAPAAAARGDAHRSFAESIIDRINDRLCDRQKALGGRLPIPLIHPSKCKKEPPPPPEEPTVVLTADPLTINEGDSSTLEWTSENADTCEASGGWDGERNTSGTEVVSPSETTMYHIDCFGPGGVAGDDVVVTVIPDEPDAPTVEITADPMTITEGESSELSWNSENADTCTASNGWIGDRALDGTEVVTPATTTTYAIECEGEGGTAQDSVTVTVTPDEPETGTLIVRKVVIRDDGNDAATTTFSFEVNDEDPIFFDDDGEVQLTRPVGTYTINEGAHDGFTMSTSNCDAVELSEGETEICTITNNDEAEEPETAVLTLVKVVVNNNGGEATTTDWTLVADGPTDISGVTGSAAVTEAVVEVGSYDLSETNGPEGYTASNFVCQINDGPDVAGNTVVLEAGDDVVCTITNDDEEEEQVGTLVISEVLYNPSVAQGVEAGNEWVEIFNGTAGTLNLSGYFIQDNSETFILPQGTTLASGSFLLLTGSSTTADLWTVPSSATWLVLPGFTRQLSNENDSVELFNTASSSVDAVCWGPNDKAFDCDALVVDDGESLGRIDKFFDTGTAADWQAQTPNPGE